MKAEPRSSKTTFPLTTDLVVLVPVLGRPHRVTPLLDSLERTVPESRVVFLADLADQDQIQAVLSQPFRYLTIDIDTQGGNYAEKINRGVELTEEPLLFIGADDLDFHRGWLEAAKAALRPGIGLVGTQDLCNPRVIAGEHATHFLMSREYAELPLIDGGRGPLCELYPHEFVDDELIGTARKRGAYAFAADSIVEHLHPDAGKAPRDSLYDGQRRRMREGRPIFERRKPLWT